MIPHHQMTLADVFTEIRNLLDSDKPAFLQLLENTIDLYEVVPASFRNHYYAWTGRPREYHLDSMLWALIIQKIFSIPTDQLLLVFLQYSNLSGIQIIRPMGKYLGRSCNAGGIKIGDTNVFSWGRFALPLL